MTRTQAYWLCQLAGWTLFCAAELVVHPENWAGGEVQTTLLTWVFRVVVGIGFTHAVRIHAKRHGWARRSIKQLVPRLAGTALLLGIASWGLKALPVSMGLLDPVAQRTPPHTEFSAFSTSGKIAGLIEDTIEMGAWMAIYFGLHAAWNYRQATVDRWKLRAQAEAARLEALKLQLNPHFFFNSLASVRALISEAPGRAKKMVARLARLLRKTLDAEDEKTVPLRDELSTVRTYLKLEKVRFENRLDWTIDVAEPILDASVPFMLVQTLAENAVKHGIAQRPEGGILTIEASVAGAANVIETSTSSMLRLRVSNPGQLDSHEDGSAHGSGSGLRNARERLRLLFGDEARLELTESGSNTVTATAWIPLQEAARQPGSGSREASGTTAAAEKEQKDRTGAPRGPAQAETSTVPSLSHTSASSAASSSSTALDDEGDGGTHLWGGSLSYWLCQGGGWGSLMGAIALFIGISRDLPWTELLVAVAVIIGIFGGLGVGLTHAFRVYAKKYEWADLPPSRLVTRAGAAAVLLGSTYILILAPPLMSWQDLPTAWDAWLVAVLGELAPPIFGFSVLTGVWMAIYFGVHAVWNYRQAEVDRWRLQAQTEAARLEALKLQLNPHFFFNCLSSVRALITEEPGRAKKMVARLARLLRRTLQAGDEKTVPLREELSTTETYLQLEKVRYEDRLEWDMDVGEAASGRQVPFMLVQTLTENAVKHGIGQRRVGGTIRIGADTTDGDALRLRVTNPGKLDGGSARGSGTGLANTRERLQLLFGDEASLELSQSGPETVTATAWIPRPAALEDRFVEDGHVQGTTAAREKGVLAGAGVA